MISSDNREKIQLLKRNRGSTLTLVLIAIVVLSTVGLSFMQFTLGERIMASRSNQNYVLFNLAEGGLDRAIWAINNEHWTGWADLRGGEDRYRPPEEMIMSNGVSAKLQVIIQNVGTNTKSATMPVIYAEAIGTLPNGSIQKKQLRIQYGIIDAGPGIVARDAIELGGSLNVDSYDSTLGPPDPLLNRSAEAVVSSVSTASDALSASGNADIYGYAGTGQEDPDITGNALKVHGPDTPPGVRVDPTRLFHDFTYEFPPITEPSWSGSITSLPSAVGGVITVGNTDGTPVTYKVDSLNLDSVDIKVVGPVTMHVQNGMTIKQGNFIEVESGGSCEVYTPGDISMGGRALINLTNRPKNMKIFGTNPTPNAQKLDIDGQGILSAFLYAPNADASMGGNAEFRGSMVVNEIDFGGTIDFHYDTTASEGTLNGGVIAWHEIRRADQRLDFATYVSDNP